MNEHPLNDRHFSPSTPAETASAEEDMVTDDRASLSPAQMVERKLASMLRSTPLPVSRLQEPSPKRHVLS
jgi:hypothetical protein